MGVLGALERLEKVSNMVLYCVWVESILWIRVLVVLEIVATVVSRWPILSVIAVMSECIVVRLWSDIVEL